MDLTTLFCHIDDLVQARLERKNKQTKKDEDRGKLRSDRHRWKVEPTFDGGQTCDDRLLVGKEKFRSSKLSLTLLAS